MIFGSDLLQPIDVNTKLVIATKVIQAIAYLHNQNPAVIHRDIKPENILISKDLLMVKLCDMGLSKLKTFNKSLQQLRGLKGCSLVHQCIKPQKSFLKVKVLAPNQIFEVCLRHWSNYLKF